MDKLQLIRNELEERKGELRKISRKTGLSYDTIMRIKRGDTEPGFYKVEALADYFGWCILHPKPCLKTRGNKE